MHDDITFKGAIEQAHQIASGAISAVELLDATLANYERHNPDLNAVIVTQVDVARQRAKQADASTARGESWGPLHGVPITVKEAFDWEGTPTTWGFEHLHDNVASTNAAAVDRLLDGGAVLYGKTNVPVGLADWQSFNPVYGTTNNPWDLDRVPGGSSGGSAAALATGMSALEFGSDIGASIRNPAHYCGVFGHKPTFGLVPEVGHRLPGMSTGLDIAVVGPLARTSADLDLALQLTAGPVGVDDRGYEVRLPPSTKHRASDFRVAAQLTSPCLTQDSELTDQLQHALDVLAKAGVTIDDKARPSVDQERAYEVYLLLLRAATAGLADEAAYEEHREAAARYDDGDRSYRAIAGKGTTMTHREWLQLNDEREQQRMQWDAFFNDFDLLLCPIAASAAFPHDHEGERPDRVIPINGGTEPCVDQLFWAGWSCGVYLPGTVAPAGLTRSGLPCGLQIVAPHLGDRLGISFASIVENELGGFVPPPRVDLKS